MSNELNRYFKLLVNPIKQKISIGKSKFVVTYNVPAEAADDLAVEHTISYDDGSKFVIKFMSAVSVRVTRIQ